MWRLQSVATTDHWTTETTVGSKGWKGWGTQAKRRGNTTNENTVEPIIMVTSGLSTCV